MHLIVWIPIYYLFFRPLNCNSYKRIDISHRYTAYEQIFIFQ